MVVNINASQNKLQKPQPNQQAPTPQYQYYVPTYGGSSYQNTSTFKMPVSVTFVTGISLVIVNNIANGKVPKLYGLIWQGKEVDKTKFDFRTLLGEIIFVLVVSFFAEISGAVSDIAFALFIALWMVWAINNTSTINKWTSNIRGA